MPNFFEVVDRSGIKVFCTKEQWDSHVALNHSIMVSNVDAIVETIREPELILPSHDTNHPLDERRIYTKESKSATYYPKLKYTHVVVFDQFLDSVYAAEGCGSIAQDGSQRLPS